MPTIQPAEIWQESGRYGDYGAEMLRIKDRHEREMLYGPTNEEQITRHLPGRGEVLPRLAEEIFITSNGSSVTRCGPIRRHAGTRIPDEGRLFLRPRRGRRAPDPITACSSPICGLSRAWGLRRMPMKADTGADRRRFSPRVHHPRRDGREPGVCDRDLIEMPVPDETPITIGTCSSIVERLDRKYAATNEMHDAGAFRSTTCPRKDGFRRAASRSDNFYWHEIFRADESQVQGPDGRLTALQWRVLRRRRSRLVGGHHRSEPRQRRHHLAEVGRSLSVGLINLKPGEAPRGGARAVCALGGESGRSSL